MIHSGNQVYNLKIHKHIAINIAYILHICAVLLNEMR